MAVSENKKKKCETVIPKSWPQLTGPAWTPGMTADQGRAAWYQFLREQAKVGPTPRVPRTE